MSKRSLLRRLPFRSLVMAFLVVYGVVPLGIGAFLTVQQNRAVLETQQRVNLAHSVESQSSDLASRLDSATQRLEQLAASLSAIPSADIAKPTREAWVEATLRGFVTNNPDLLDVRVSFPDSQRGFSATQLHPELAEKVADVVRGMGSDARRLPRFLTLDGNRRPAALVSRVVAGEQGSNLVLSAVVAAPMRSGGEAAVFLIDREGNVLWSEDGNESARLALLSSPMLGDFADHPNLFVAEYAAPSGFGSRSMIAQVSPIGDSGWGIVIQQPRAIAFGAARRVVQTTLMSLMIMMVLAVFFAVGASQLISAPISRMSQHSKEIAAGNFSGRVPKARVSRELGDLAESFNLMSGRLEATIQRLKEAAETNHELFLGSIRALLAAVEAKEPYIRGHSERVAAFSRSIGGHLEFEEIELDRLWVSGLLHDIGKIGIEDGILRKGDVLTPREFDRMKTHTTIGAEILSKIELLHYSVDVVLYHHERWNGDGYPEALSGENIPLAARIVAVADSFDAMTTQRVYQDAMSGEQACAWIGSEGGRSFDSDVVRAFVAAVESGEIEGPRASETTEAVAAASSGQHS